MVLVADVEQGDLAPATAYEIGKLDDPAEQQEMAERVVAEKLTRQEAVEVVRRRKEKGASIASSAPGRTGERPAPVEFRVSDHVVVSVKYRKADRLSVVQALRLALKQAQALEKGGQEPGQDQAA